MPLINNQARQEDPEGKPESVSLEEMRAYVVGKASVEVRRKVRDQLQVPGSFADTWLKSFLSAAGDPFNINVADLPNDETKETDRE